MIRVLFTFLLISCGTIKKHHNIIPIDSTPRNLWVVDHKGEILGKTPFFYKIDQKSKQTFDIIPNINYPHINEQYQYECQTNWWGSVFPNSVLLPFFPTGTVFGGIFHAVDHYTNNHYSCKEGFHFNNKKLKIKEHPPKTAKRVLILPPRFLKERTSTRFVKAWTEKHKKKGIEFLNYEETTGDLSFIGITYQNDNNPLKLKHIKLWPVASKYQADHFLYFEKNGQTLSPALYDIFTLKKNKNYRFPIQALPPSKKFDWALEALDASISFFPNSVLMAYNFSPQVNYFDKTNQTLIEKQSTKRHPKALPQVLTAISISNVDHPQFFKPWDWSVHFFPALSGISWKIDKDIGGTPYSVQYLGLGLTGNASFSFHTPLGSFSAFAGFGGEYHDMKDNLNTDFNSFSTVVKFGVFYTAFINDSLYLKIGGDTSAYKENHIKSDLFELRNVQEIYLGLGYFYPEAQTHLRKLFNIFQ
jgi:hypothetical protein